MDAVLTAITGAAPQLGPAGVLLLVLGLFMRREAQSTERQSIELDRQAKAHDAEILEKNQEIDRLRSRLVEAETRIDTERELRREAQETGRHRRGDTP